MKEPFLYNGIKDFGEKKPVRFCMPGHKGKKTGSFLDDAYLYDVTELFSTDNLQNPTGIIKKSEEAASKIYKSGFTCFSAGGASPLVKAAVYLAAGSGKILAQRESHLSFVHGAALSGTEIKWLYGSISEKGIPYPPKAEAVEKALNSEKEIKAVFITSPNYYGVMADIVNIGKICKLHKALLIVDNSHGSHLMFLKNGEKHPNLQGADIVIDSAHKTLPALTGSALLHINTGEISKEQAKEAILMFSSTSPSYLIMSSLDYAVALCDKTRSKFEKAAENAQKIKSILKEKGFECLEGEDTDPLRLTIVTAAAGINSEYANKRLFEKGIACEMADKNSLILILSPQDTYEELLLVANELDLLYNESGNKKNKQSVLNIPRLTTALSVREAFFAPKEKVLLSKSKGRIIGECITCYPPCVPIAVSGELISDELIEIIREFAPKEEITVIKES